jgi:CO/xanthine dehydrogenase FAD-binding subunit
VRSISTPQTLQAALTLAYRHKKTTRWLVGKSDLLRLDYSRVPSDAFIIDARGIAEFRSVERMHDGAWTIGAFASPTLLDRYGQIGDELFGETAMPLLLLLGLGATVRIGMPGTIRTVPLDSICFDHRLRIEPHEVPIALEVPRREPGLAFAERRRTTADGPASYDLRLLVSMKVGSLKRIELIRIALALDGSIPRRAVSAEERLAGRCLGAPSLEAEALGEAARLTAQALRAADAKTSAAARALPALAFAALKEAYGAACRARSSGAVNP